MIAAETIPPQYEGSKVQLGLAATRTHLKVDATIVDVAGRGDLSSGNTAVAFGQSGHIDKLTVMDKGKVDTVGVRHELADVD